MNRDGDTKMNMAHVHLCSETRKTTHNSCHPRISLIASDAVFSEVSLKKCLCRTQIAHCSLTRALGDHMTTHYKLHTAHCALHDTRHTLHTSRDTRRTQTHTITYRATFESAPTRHAQRITDNDDGGGARKRQGSLHANLPVGMYRRAPPQSMVPSRSSFMACEGALLGTNLLWSSKEAFRVPR